MLVYAHIINPKKLNESLPIWGFFVGCIHRA